MRSAWIAGWVVVASACGAAIPPLPSHGGPAWRELTSAHFTLWTDGAPARGAAIMRELEHLRQVVVGVAFPTAPDAGRVLVIALRDDDELRAFSWTDEARAFAAPARPPLWQPVIVMPAESNSDRGDLTIAHELAHIVSFAVVHHQPRWFAEGLAMFFETVGLDPDSKQVDIGVAPQYRGQPARLARFVPISSLFGWRAIGPDENRMYSTAWALFTFLINEHRAELVHYMLLLDETPTQVPEQLWAAAFPSLPLGDLDGALRAWIVSGHHVVSHFTSATRAWPVSERALGDADVYAIRALLRCHDAHCTASAPDLAAAIAADPTNVLARLVAYLASPTLSAADARALTVAHPDDWHAWWLLANAMPPADEAIHARTTACALIAQNPAIVAPPKLCPP